MLLQFGMVASVISQCYRAEMLSWESRSELRRRGASFGYSEDPSIDKKVGNPRVESSKTIKINQRATREQPLREQESMHLGGYCFDGDRRASRSKSGSE